MLGMFTLNQAASLAKRFDVNDGVIPYIEVEEERLLVCRVGELLARMFEEERP